MYVDIANSNKQPCLKVSITAMNLDLTFYIPEHDFAANLGIKDAKPLLVPRHRIRYILSRLVSCRELPPGMQRVLHTVMQEQTAYYHRTGQSGVKVVLHKTKH